MSIADKIANGLQRAGLLPYPSLDRLYLPQDRQQIRRTRNLRLIPLEADRRGGKYAYAEWAHVIGIFQTLICLHLERKERNRILDVGCGTGLLAIASEPFVTGGGRYTGIDVAREDVDFCRGHYPAPDFEFVHLDVANPAYAPDQQAAPARWPLESACFDLVTALSVWTHLAEKDALFYFAEIGRVLKPGGKAIVTFFLLDDAYRSSLGARSDREGRFNMSRQNEWIFDLPSYGSSMWLHPRWAQLPEVASGVNDAGLERLLASSGMNLVACHEGNWKEVPGVFFQDVLVFRKP